MSIDRKYIDEAKKSLKTIKGKGKTGLTRKQFVSELIQDIHARMKEGHKIHDIWKELNDPLPDDSKIKESAFRAYVQIARKEADLEPVKKWTKRTEKPKEKTIKENTLDNPEANDKPKTENDFRDTGAEV